MKREWKLFNIQEDFLLTLRCEGESKLYPPKGKPFGCVPQQVIAHVQRKRKRKRHKGETVLFWGWGWVSTLIHCLWDYFPPFCISPWSWIWPMYKQNNLSPPCMVNAITVLFPPGSPQSWSRVGKLHENLARLILLALTYDCILRYWLDWH